MTISLVSSDLDSSYLRYVDFKDSDKFAYIKGLYLETRGFYTPSTSLILDFKYDSLDSKWLADMKHYEFVFESYGDVMINKAARDSHKLEVHNIAPENIRSVLDLVINAFDLKLSIPEYKALYEVAGINFVVGVANLADDHNYAEIIDLIGKFPNQLHDVDGTGKSLLQLAYLKNDFHLGNIAIRMGISPDFKDLYGKSILTYACENGDYNWFEYAISNGANIYERFEGANMLSVAVSNYVDLLKMCHDMFGDRGYSGTQYAEWAHDYQKIISELAHKQPEFILQSTQAQKSPMQQAMDIAYIDIHLPNELISSLFYEVNGYDCL